MPRLGFLALLLGRCLLVSAAARAQPLPSPYAQELRVHYYEQLAKSPWRALGWELLCPGVGSVYVGVYAPAVGALAGSLAGAGLWLAGALRERPAMERAGLATFVVARAYGVVSAPVSALLLNAAFRRQLGIRATFR